MGRSIGCGALLIAMAMCWTPSFSLGAINRPQIGSFRKLFKAFGQPRVVVTDKLRSYGGALKNLAPGIEHCSHKGINN
jgi:hypothetical protein